MEKSNSPFWHYSSIYDAEALVNKFEDKQREAVPDRLVNYLGAVINPRFLPHVLPDCAGKVEGPPAPNNWHSEIAEFAAVLRAVDQAVGSFTVIELGCG